MDTRIALVIVRMEEALDAPLRVPDLAAIARVSPSRFAHLFRKEVGVAPGRYLHTMRMRRARALLERTPFGVRDVMSRVGFRDPSHFARDFRRFHGVSPSAIRGRASPPALPTGFRDLLPADRLGPASEARAADLRIADAADTSGGE
jgi:AraC family transcriptional regulator, arabinose operon regulatory protein